MAIIDGRVPQPTSRTTGSHTVVVKLAPLPPGNPAAAAAGPARERLQSALPADLVVRPYFPLPVSGPGAAALGANAMSGDLAHFVAIEVASADAGDQLVQSLLGRSDVAVAYLEGGPTPPPSVPVGSNPLSVYQGYLNAAPEGIDARWAWANIATRTVGFVDLEQGWTLNHEDLVANNITLISGVNEDYFGHGTAVLGEVAAVDNALGVLGITFNDVSARVISQWREAGRFSTAQTIFEAALAMNGGDVLLLEAQVAYPSGSGKYFPVEVEDASFDAIRFAVDRGIIVVEAGANGGNNLDDFRNAAGKQIFNRDNRDFRDSGAIMVGAASSSVPHKRLSFSNFGNRIDCYAWGDNVQTCGDGWDGNQTNTYTRGFGGTSSASPIVAGAALKLQGWALARGSVPYLPGHMRELLSNETLNTQAPGERIGAMPNLRAIVEAHRARSPEAAIDA